jgi:hypothetical protein
VWVFAFRWTAVAATLALAVALIVEKPWERRPSDLSSKNQNLQAVPVAVQSKLQAEPAKEVKRAAERDAKDAAAKSPVVASNSVTGGLSVNRRRASAAQADDNESNVKRDESAARFDQLNSQPVTTETAAVYGGVAGGPVPKSLNLPAALESAPAPASLPAFTQMQTTGFLAATVPGSLAPANTLDFGKLKQNGELSAGFPSQTSRFVYVFHPLTASAKKVFSGVGNSSTTIVGMGMFSASSRAGLSRSRALADTAAADAADPGKVEASAAELTAPARASLEMKPPGTGTQTSWRVVDGKLMKSSGAGQWQEAELKHSSASQFSVVTAQGNNVWAGCSNALLFHSQDGGTTWEKVKLGETAAGNVVKIAVDGTNVVVTTSAERQTWVSHDGGQTWTLQNPQN